MLNKFLSLESLMFQSRTVTVEMTTHSDSLDAGREKFLPHSTNTFAIYFRSRTTSRGLARGAI